MEDRSGRSSRPVSDVCVLGTGNIRRRANRHYPGCVADGNRGRGNLDRESMAPLVGVGHCVRGIVILAAVALELITMVEEFYA